MNHGLSFLNCGPNKPKAQSVQIFKTHLFFRVFSSLRTQFTNLQVWVNNETVELSLSPFAFNYSFTVFHLPKPKMPKRGRTKKTAKATESVTEPQSQTQAPQFIDLEIQGSHPHFICFFRFPFLRVCYFSVQFSFSENVSN